MKRVVDPSRLANQTLLASPSHHISKRLKMKRWLLALLLPALLLLVIPIAYASVSLSLDLKQLSQDSSMIVRGTVKKTEGMWSGKRIVTKITLSIDSALKGSPSTEVVFYTPGGVVDGVGMKVSGAPSFVEKEEVLVFLSLYKSNYSVLGLGQGKYSIRADGAGKKLAIPDTDNLSLVKKLPDGSLAPAEAPKAMPIIDLESEIKKHLR
jgi:hypothetical protein